LKGGGAGVGDLYLLLAQLLPLKHAFLRMSLALTLTDMKYALFILVSLFIPTFLVAKVFPCHSGQVRDLVGSRPMAK